MKKEWALLIGIVTVTLLIAIGLIRMFAPQLLGIPASLQLVKVSKKVPPFYEGIFRKEDFDSREFQINDPYVEIRSKPLIPELWMNQLIGPHDILGFRNRYVPNVADIVTIGDSQTYGTNVMLENNWPNQMLRNLNKKKPVLYCMAAGGWGAVQYLDMFSKGSLLQPQIVVVSFYTGNDPLESFTLAYSVDKWESLRVDPSLSPKDAPVVQFPPPESEWWHVKFKDGTETTFTPTLRLSSNQDHPAVRAGYAIMRNVAQQIAEKAQSLGIRTVFSIIPTKELVYGKKVSHDEITPPEDYLALLSSEEMNIKRLASDLGRLPNSVYVDLVTPLQEAALNPTPLYPSNANGHPIEEGYAIIARTLTPVVDNLLHDSPRGLFALQLSPSENLIVLIKDDGVWIFEDADSARANGWFSDTVNTLSYRDIANMPLLGFVKTIDPERFGPASIGNIETKK